MTIEHNNCDLDVVSIDTQNLNIINQKAIDIQLHKVETIYKVLSKNNANWNRDTVFAPGYFNNKTSFLLGEINSILVLDENLNILSTPSNNISNITAKQHDDKLFILYPVPCFNMKQNYRLTFTDLIESKDFVIDLDSHLGEKFGKFLATGQDKESIYPNKNFLRLVIDEKNGLSLDKNFLINSNPSFVLGILDGYYNSIKKSNNYNFVINKNVNLYVFTNILNYLGASYSIRKIDNVLNLVYQLPHIFSQTKLNQQNSRFFKKSCYVVYDNKITLFPEVMLENLQNGDDKLKTISCQNLLIPISAFDFIKLSEDEINDKKIEMYDLTSENYKATNYSLPFTPFLKNSDGDILTISGIFLSEANESAKIFSPENKDYYKDLNDGEILNWIADDAILGLYASTK